jgi:hypothetical protein
MTGIRVFIKRGNLGQWPPRTVLPLGSRLEGEIHLQTSTISKEEEGGQGPLPPRAVAAAAAVSFISSGLHLSINNSLFLTMSMCE